MITDTLPAEVSVVDVTANGVVSGNTVTWSIGSMTPNTTTSVQVKVKVADVVSEGTVLLNTTSVTGNQPGGAPLPTDSDTLQTPVSSAPDLVLQYTVDKAIASPGERLTYTLRVRNAGNANATDAVIAATLPPNTTSGTISGSGQFEPDKAVWTAPSLAPGGFIDLQFTADLSPTVPDGTREPSISGFAASNAAARVAAVVTQVVAQPLLTVTKSGPNSVEAGTAIDYQLGYSNAGNAVAADTVIEDTLPVGTTFVSASDGGAETAPGSGIVRWDLGTLAVGASGTVDLRVQTTALPDNTQLVNQTSLTSTTLPGAVTATATTSVRSHTELDITIVAATDPIKVGERQVLTVTWANNGNQDTTNAVVKATVPADTTFDVAGSGGAFAGNEVTWTVGNLAAGAQGQATFEVVVASTAVDGEQLKSVADLSATDGLPDTDEALFIVDAAPVIPPDPPKYTRVGSIDLSFPQTSTPPPANTPFTVQTVFNPTGNGQSCRLSNVEVTLAGVTSSGTPQASAIYYPDKSTSFTFDFPGLPAGTDLSSIVIDYSAISQDGLEDCSCIPKSCIDTNGPIPPIPVPPTPRLVVDKQLASGQSAQVVPDESVSYVLTIENTGNGDAANVTVTDVLDPDLLYEGSGTTPNSAPAKGSTGTVTWSLASLAAGAKVSLTLNTRVDLNAPQGFILNTGKASVGGVTTSSPSVTIQVNREPNVTLSKTINGDTSQRETLPAGDTVTYVLTYENVGFAEAESVVITDTLPAELTGAPTLLPGAPISNYDPVTREATWDLGTVSPGARQQVTVSAQIDPTASGLFENRAEVTWTDGTTPDSANSNYADISVIAEPFFGLTKAVDKTNAGPGDELTYTINYANTGSAAGINTVVTDTIPVGLTPVAGSYPGATYVPGATASDPDTLTWSLGSVPASATGSLTYKVTVDASTPASSLVNQAEMIADNVFGAVVATANTAINIAGVIDLVASKTLQSGAAQYVGDGDSIAYDLSITNNGNAVASNVLLVDPLPKGTTLDTSLSPGWSLVGNNLELSLPDIPGQSSSATYPLVLTVDGSQLTDGDVIFNQATGSGTETGGQTDSAVTGLVSVTYNAPRDGECGQAGNTP